LLSFPVRFDVVNHEDAIDNNKSSECTKHEAPDGIFPNKMHGDGILRPRILQLRTVRVVMRHCHPSQDRATDFSLLASVNALVRRVQMARIVQEANSISQSTGY